MCSNNNNNLKGFSHNWLKFVGFPLLRKGQAVPSHFHHWDMHEKLTTKTVNFPKNYTSYLQTVLISNYLA